MLPSSSSGNYARSSSSASLRPPSSASRRPGSSASLHRPSSALPARPHSSASNRPSSRLSQRAKSRSRLIPLAQVLVTQTTRMTSEGPDADDYNTAVDFVVQNLEATSLVKGSAGVDMNLMDKQIHGHVEKAKIQLRHSLGQALETAYDKLKLHTAHSHDLDEAIQIAHQPDHLQLLIKLANPPEASTLAYADSYLDRITNPPPPTPTLTWKDILAEEPFEGDHWDGVYGLPPGSVANAHTGADCDDDSSPSLSPFESDDDFDLQVIDDSLSSADDHDATLSTPGPELSPNNIQEQSTRRQRFEHRQAFERLQNRQYWHAGWRGDTVNTDRPFDIGDPSTFGPSINRALAHSRKREAASMIDASEREWYIEEVDAVREILMALQGRKNILLNWKDNVFLLSERSPKLAHLSLASQRSILSSLGLVASVVQQLRDFSAFILSRSASASHIPHSLHQPSTKPVQVTRTLEAFADALARQIRAFDSWCAAREEGICHAQAGSTERELVVSLLSTEKAIQDRFEGPFTALREVVSTVASSASLTLKPDHDKVPEATWTLIAAPVTATTTRLLDTLLAAACQHAERQDSITANALLTVFAATAEPTWGMVHKWLKDGMGLGLTPGQDDELDDEFFIESTGLTVGMMGMGMGLLDPEFWTEGYVLKHGTTDEDEEDWVSREAKMVPAFLKHAAGPVLSAGKSKGLLRALGMTTRVTEQVSFGSWRSFTELLTSGNSGYDPAEMVTAPGNSGFISVDTLSRLVYDELYPHYQAAGGLLAKVLVEECGFWKHITAIEGFYLMKRGDVMSHFQDMLFAKMDAQQGWADFHSLNTVFNDVVQMNSILVDSWMEPSLVRLSYRGGKEKERTVVRSVTAIDGLAVEYAVPFPLTYIIPPKALQVYAEIFVFLLQIRRAKSVLEKILVRGEAEGAKRLHSEMKIFYSMRSRLSWFINAFLNFLTTYVIHSQVAKFHSEFKQASSLDEMIALHNSHLEKLQGRCLLQPNTSALHRAILAILDIALNFSNRFAAFAGDVSMHDISRLSLSVGHRSKRLKNQRRNVIGFQIPPSFLGYDSDSDTDEDDRTSPPEASFSLGAVSTSADHDLPSRVEKMFTELDGLVRFVRRGIESLAGSGGEAAPTFGVLAFTLEDWDS